MKTVIASGLSEEAVRILKNKSIDVFSFSPNPSVGEYVSRHADLSFLYCGNGRLFISKEMSGYKEKLCSMGLTVEVIPEDLGKKYPDDVKLCCVPLGKYLICNIDTVSPFVLQYFKNIGKTIVNVRQGYTKCSVVPVNSNAVITDDESVYAACSAEGIDTLKVSKGSVVLPGFPYGFIGGAAGKISESEIAFNGDITTHSDCERITDFLRKYSMSAVSLGKNRLSDVGSIIPLYQEDQK